MLEHHFTPVWFASKNRLQSATKWIVFDDFGTLDVETDSLHFRGRRYSLPMPHIRGVSLVRQRLPWVHYLWGVPLVIVCLACPMVLLNGVLSVTLDYTLSNTVVLLWGGIVVGIATLFTAFGILVGRCTRWIEITYTDEEQNLREAYLADGSILGWGGILGGTMQMYQMLHRTLTAEE